MTIAFILSIGALKTAGSIVDVHQAPYLYALLNNWVDVMVLVVGVGVRLAAVLGTLRFLYGCSLKPFIQTSGERNAYIFAY